MQAQRAQAAASKPTAGPGAPPGGRAKVKQGPVASCDPGGAGPDDAPAPKPASKCWSSVSLTWAPATFPTDDLALGDDPKP